MAQGGDGYGDVQRYAQQLHLHLAGGHSHASARRAGARSLENFGGKNVGQRSAAQDLSPFRGRHRMKHAEQCLINVGDATAGIEREHAGGNTLEDSSICRRRWSSSALAALRSRLEASICRGCPRGPRHAVERAHQIADLVGSADRDAIIETLAKFPAWPPRALTMGV